jgi:hypothetical protein
MQAPLLLRCLPGLCLALSLMTVSKSPAALTYSGGTYTENFNYPAFASSGAWFNNVTIPGWYWAISNSPPSGYSTPANYTATSGAGAAQGAPLSLGNSDDRALGSQNNNYGGQSITYGLSFNNSTGATLDSFTLGYTGEQWRAISQATYGANTLVLQYQVFNAGSGSLTAPTGWLNASHLDYVASYVPSGNIQVDGNNSLYRSIISGTVYGLNWQNGQELWIRWVDTNAAPTGNIDNNSTLSMVGIDDVSFSAAVPEPGRRMLALFAIGILALRRRR